MSKKFTGVHSGGQNIPVYDKDAHSAIEQKLDTSAFQSVSGNFLTAVPDAYATKDYADSAAASAAAAAASGKLDTDTFSQVSGDFLTAVPQSYLQNTDLTVTSGKVTEISGIPLSAGGTLPDTIPVSGVSGISVTETENEVLIGISADFATSSDLEKKLDTSAFSSVSGNFLTAVPENYSTKEYLSEQISGKYDTSSFAAVSGDFLTAVPESAISGFATHDEVESATSGKADVSALEGLATETYVDSAVSGKQDTLEFGYDENSAISGINGSALAGGIDPSMLTGYAEYSAISAKLAPEDIAIFTYDDSACPYAAIKSAYDAGKLCFAKHEHSNEYYPLLWIWSHPFSSDIKQAFFGRWRCSLGNYQNGYNPWSGTLTEASLEIIICDNRWSADNGWNYGWTQNTFYPQKAGDYYSASNPSGFLTAIPQSAVSGYMQTSGLEYDGDKISGYMGSAFKAGDELPSGVMNTSALEYNAVNEISGYNGSAIAQYGAEKQWLVHDDTLVHAANSAQYALGVNLSAVAQLLGVDETVLFSGSTQSPSLTDSIWNYKKVLLLIGDDTNATKVSNSQMYYTDDIAAIGSGFSIFQTCKRYDGGYVSMAAYINVNNGGSGFTVASVGGWASWDNSICQYNGAGTWAPRFYKVIGIGRKS